MDFEYVIQGGILMAVHLYGNVNGSYQKPSIDLFEAARKQNNQPVSYSDTEAGKNTPVIKVNISKEGLRALHGSKLNGSADIQKSIEDIRYISEHQPVESFTNRLARVMPHSYVQVAGNSNDDIAIHKKADLLLDEFRKICDEITYGYDEGNRIRLIEESTTEDGYRRLSREDELSILLSEFKDFVEARFGEKHQEEAEKTAKAINDIQKVKQELGYGDISYYEPEYIPEGFVNNLIMEANKYLDKIIN